MATLYDKIGGEGAVNAAVELFYQKVLADERIRHFFANTSMNDQIRKQKIFLTYAFGGIPKYPGKNMRSAHAHLVAMGLNDSHFDAVLENLAGTLVDLKVPTELIKEAAAIAESTRNDVLNK